MFSQGGATEAAISIIWCVIFSHPHRLTEYKISVIPKKVREILNLEKSAYTVLFPRLAYKNVEDIISWTAHCCSASIIIIPGIVSDNAMLGRGRQFGPPIRIRSTIASRDTNPRWHGRFVLLPSNAHSLAVEFGGLVAKTVSAFSGKNLHMITFTPSQTHVQDFPRRPQSLQIRPFLPRGCRRVSNLKSYR
jgi:hypothetical protein